jgi:hypothetical protein
MWPATTVYSPTEHKYFLDNVLVTSPGVEKWLQEHHKLLWARSKFSTDIKCDYINNNLAECWNAWIKEFKDLPLHCMVDAIRDKGVVMFERRRRISIALHRVILPAVIHELNTASKGLGHLKVTKGLPDHTEVTEIYKDEEVENMLFTTMNRVARIGNGKLHVNLALMLWLLSPVKGNLNMKNM